MAKQTRKSKKSGTVFGKGVEVRVKDEMNLYHNMVGKTTTDSPNADGQYSVDFGSPTGIQLIHADDLDLAPGTDTGKSSFTVSINGGDPKELSQAAKDIILGTGTERPYVVLAASIKDGFCDYTYQITQGIGAGDPCKQSGTHEIEDDLRHAFGKLIVHLAVIDDVFKHSGIEIDDITRFEVHDLTALYYVSGMTIKGSEANESVVLKGSKRVSAAGGRIDLTSPKIPLDNKSSYPFYKELKAALDTVREEVALYKEGKYIPDEEGDPKANAKQMTIDAMVSEGEDTEESLKDEFAGAAV